MKPNPDKKGYSDTLGAPRSEGSTDVATGSTMACSKGVLYRFKVIGDNALRYKLYAPSAPTTGVYLSGNDEIWQRPPVNMTLSVIQVGNVASSLNVTPMLGSIPDSIA